jgi:5-methylcytosine-specific restriction endonuclease McrA
MCRQRRLPRSSTMSRKARRRRDARRADGPRVAAGGARREGADARAAHPRPRPYASIPRWAVRALRTATHAACGRRCVYCADRLALDGATLDHVVPRRLGGPTTADNVVVACYACNLLKGGRAPFDFFRAHPWAADNFLRYATRVAHAHKHDARAAMSLAYAAAA